MPGPSGIRDTPPSTEAATPVNAEDTDDPSLKETWVPSTTGANPPSPSTEPAKPDDTEDPSLKDTWVPPPSGQRPDAPSSNAEQVDSDSSEDSDPSLQDTWVPPDVDGPPPKKQDEDDSDISLVDTWVPPDGTPPDAVDDMDEDLANPVGDDVAPEKVDPNRTWTPSSTPTHHGLGITPPNVGDTAENDKPASSKTWTPSDTPTHHDFSFDFGTGLDDDDEETASESDAKDANKTSLPSETPTIDLIANPPPGRPPAPAAAASGATDDFDQTQDLGVTPKRHVEGEPDTFVLPNQPNDKSVDRAMLETLAAALPSEFDQTEVFSKTIGMRNLSDEEYDDWQSDVAEKSGPDTVVLAGSDAASTMTPPSDAGTQVWHKQSTDGLDGALTIRARPVGGDESFKATIKSENPDYDIVEKIAEGGMGAIYVARQTSLNRELALKTLKPLKESDRKIYETQGRLKQVDKQRREMFLSEALVTANLVHPHIIPIHDLCQTVDGSPFYAMKRVHGIPWSDRISDMTLEENLDVLLKTCDAMAYAHHYGVLNRDLKPENIMLGEFGEVLVLDWGLAVPALEADRKKFQSPAAAFGAGTPAYMSPELWSGPADAIGTWSDIYLLGATLFEIVTGLPPHKFPKPDKNAGNTGLWMVIDEVVRVNEIRQTDVHGELMDIALKAMSTKPDDRYASVLELQQAVKNFQTHEESRRLAARATATLKDASEQPDSRGYQGFQTAAALYEEAYTEWPDNKDARDGLRRTRLAYAGLAQRKGDYDLGLQIAAQEEGDEFTTLTNQLSRARSIRNRLKQATITAAGIILLVGSISFVQAILISQKNTEITQQNNEIKSLYGDKETLLSDKERLDGELAALGEEKTALESQRSDLLIAQETLKTALADLDGQKQQLMADKEMLTAQNEDLTTAQADLKREIVKVESQKRELGVEVTKLDAEVAKLDKEKQKLALDTVRAAVELQNTAIASLIRNADYATALQRIDELMAALDKDPALASLPKSERHQREMELTARKALLQQQSRANAAPIQAQVISSSGHNVVWGDSAGQLSIWKRNPSTGELAAAATATLDVEDAVAAVAISSNDSQVVAAAGQTLHFWNPTTGQHRKVDDHDSTITAIQLGDSILLAADEGGFVKAWDTTNLTEMWSIQSDSNIRDIALMPQAGIFLLAGSRGGGSSNVLAYQMPSRNDHSARPRRLGQLQYPRGQIDPPHRIAVSPDEQLLLLSNSRNGELLVLPRRTDGEDRQRDRFPFVHAADMADQGASKWTFSEHHRPINDIAFSADGRRVVTASDDRTIGVWLVDNATDGPLKLLRRLEGHGARVNAAGFLDLAGRTVISAGADRFCRLWDVENYLDRKEDIEEGFGITAVDAPPSGSVSTGLHRVGHQASSRKIAHVGLSGPSTFQSPAVLTALEDNRASLSRQPAEPWDVQPLTAHRFIPARWPITTTVDADFDGQPIRENVGSQEVGYRILNANNQAQRGPLKSVCLSQDGTRLVTAATDGTAVMWDTDTGEPIKSLSSGTDASEMPARFAEGHDSNVARITFAGSDRNVLLTTGFDGNLCVWDADLTKPGIGHQEIRIPGLGLVHAVAASSDGQLVVTSTAITTQKTAAAAVWRTSDLLSSPNPQPVTMLLDFHKSEVSAIAVSADNAKVATGARDGRIAVWQVDGGRLIAGGQVHSKNSIVSHLHWLPDGRLFSAGFDGRLLIVETETAGEAAPASVGNLNIVSTFKHDRVPVSRVAFAPDGDRFVTISASTDKKTKLTDYRMEVWRTDVSTADQTVLPAIVSGRESRELSTVHWSPDGGRVAVVVDGNLQVFDADSWKIMDVVEAPGAGISDAVFAPPSADPTGDQPVDMVATFDGMAAHLWNLNDRSHIADFRPMYAVQSVALSSGLDHPVVLTGDRSIRIFNADPDSPSFGDSLSKVGAPHAGIITSLRFAPMQPEQSVSAQRFVSTGSDGSAAVWVWDSARETATLQHHVQLKDSAAVAAAWSPAASHILLACANGEVMIVNADSPENNPQTLPMNSRQTVRVSAAAFSKDDRFVAVAGSLPENGESRAWVFRRAEGDWQLHCHVKGHEAGGINGIAFLPDSPYLVTGGADGDVLIWNCLTDREEESPLEAYEAYQFLLPDRPVAHAAPVTAVSIAASGLIATCSEDGTAVLWQNPFGI